ncbi:unnamed protein product [Prunus armeniaca]
MGGLSVFPAARQRFCQISERSAKRKNKGEKDELSTKLLGFGGGASFIAAGSSSFPRTPNGPFSQLSQWETPILSYFPFSFLPPFMARSDEGKKIGIHAGLKGASPPGSLRIKIL